MNDKKMWYWVGGIVALAIIVWAVVNSGGLSMYPGTSVSPSSSPVGSVGPKPGAAMPKSYTDALKTYAGKRIQFDQYCQAIPTSLVFKNGVSLMLDNRSGDARTVKIGGTPHTLSGYGWTIVTLSVASSKLPAKLDIDCGSAQNVSNVMLQK